MTAYELKLENQRIFFECEGKIETLYKKYADEHNPVKVGDIIKSGGEMLRVDKIYYERIHGRFLLRDDDCPICMEYLCTPLYKDGTPKKRAVPYFVSQRHVKMINGEPYKYKEL